ncbi:DUF5131 family protein [Alteraurantiacibacter palmitatis]|uniref:Phage Gp37/Gp68 family protein n=1 Tax=Alteraurantiacibacter palmitatis TaxID=2054628 RepID=A0ABV7E7C7_9SPHN
MADNTKIEWTDATWTPVKGCTRISEGCRNCYAEVMAARFSQPGQWGHGLAKTVQTPQGRDPRWTGKVRFDDAELLKPLRWKKPRRVFVCSTADLFHESVPDEWIDRVFAVMALCPQHTFQVLTKRSSRMREYFAGDQLMERIDCEMDCLIAERVDPLERRSDDLRATAPIIEEVWPLPNVWLGVSVEDQAAADSRIPDLLAAPAAIRFISAEPLLGPVDLRHVALSPADIVDSLTCDCFHVERGIGIPAGEIGWTPEKGCTRIDWVIAGGESGPGARPMHPDWARSLRDQCAAAGVPFFFKQWGEWFPCELLPDQGDETPWRTMPSGPPAWALSEYGHAREELEHVTFSKVGKKRAGRLLDGQLHDAFPEVQP